MIQPTSKRLNLPTDIIYRLANWVRWVDIEMSRQNAGNHKANVDAENINKIGREIATSIKLYLGDDYTVEYVPIEKSGRVRTDIPETIT